MKKSIKIILLIAVITVLVFVLLDAQQSKIYKNVYKPITDKSAYPKGFEKIDAKLKEFYSVTYPEMLAKGPHDYFGSMDSTEFMQWVKLAFYYYNQQDKYTHRFNDEPFEELRNRRRIAKTNGTSFNEIVPPSPFLVFSTVKRNIEKKYPFEWGLYIRSKYMLIIDVLEKRIGGLSHNPKSKSRVFTCKVITDIKGNFKDKSIIEIVFRPVDRKMDIGNRYFVLIDGHTKGLGKYYDPYILSWDGANHKSIFKVENGNILDPNKDLKFDGQSFPIDAYSKHVKSFYKKILGDLYNEN